MRDARVPEDVLDDDVVHCRVCGKVLGYWITDDNITAFEGFRMCLGGFTCQPCLEVDDECDDD